MYAVGGNEDAAALMGAPVARTKILVYVLSGLLAGLAGALNAAWLASGVTILGTGMELEAIAAVVIGGTLLTGGFGFVSGSLVGVLLLEGHPEPHQPDRHPGLLLPTGGQRRLPGAGGRRPDVAGAAGPERVGRAVPETAEY